MMNLYLAMRRSFCLVTDYTSDLSVCTRIMDSFIDHEQPQPALDQIILGDANLKPVLTPSLQNS